MRHIISGLVLTAVIAASSLSGPSPAAGAPAAATTCEVRVRVDGVLAWVPKPVEFCSPATQTPTATQTPAVTMTGTPLATGTVTPTNTPGTAGRLGWSSAYMAGWLQPTNLETLPWTAITHLIHFSATNNTNGSLSFSNHTLTPQNMQAAVAAAHAHDKRILFAIGGAEDQNWNDVCTPAVRPVWIANVLGVVTQYGYDGVDLDVEQDWQYPAHTDYIGCFRDMRLALDTISPRPLLTTPGDPDWQQDMISQIHQYVDQVNLMDYWRSAAQAQAGLDRYTALGVPKAKLGLGVGLDDGGYDATHTADCAAKAQYAVANGYGGVMEWTITGPGAGPCFAGIATYVGP
jgi:chitinase